MRKDGLVSRVRGRDRASRAKDEPGPSSGHCAGASNNAIGNNNGSAQVRTSAQRANHNTLQRMPITHDAVFLTTKRSVLSGQVCLAGRNASLDSCHARAWLRPIGIAAKVPTQYPPMAPAVQQTGHACHSK